MSKHIKIDSSPKNENSGIILLPRVYDVLFLNFVLYLYFFILISVLSFFFIIIVVI